MKNLKNFLTGFLVGIAYVSLLFLLCFVIFIFTIWLCHTLGVIGSIVCFILIVGIILGISFCIFCNKGE
jgi:hypothetical protein